MDRLGHPPCSLLPESSWESFDARTSGSSCPCHGTTGRIASQAGTGHDDPSATGGASTDRVVVGGGRSFQRTDCRKIGSYTTDGAQVASTVVGVAGPAACRGRRGVGLGGTEPDLRDPGRRTPVRSSVRHQPRADPRNYRHRLRRSRSRAAIVQPLDTRRGGPRVCAPRDYREHLHPICGSFFKRRPIFAAFTGSGEAVAHLIERGADVNALVERFWEWDRQSTALHKAVSEDQVDIVRLLLASGAAPYIPNGWGGTAYQWSGGEIRRIIDEHLAASP